MNETATCTIADSVSTLLRQTREQRELEREEVASRINVPCRFIERIEEGRYHEISEDIYSRIYLKAYCIFLGLDVTKVQGMYRVERAALRKRHGSMVGIEENRHPRKSIPVHHLIAAPRVVRISIIVLVTAGLAIYFTTALKKIVVPPNITLSSPRDGFVTSERSITVAGKTEPEVQLLINGTQITTDNSGNFQDTLTLLEGLNIITITGSKKYSEKMTVTRRIIVQPKEHPTVSLDNVTEVPLSP